LRFHAGAALMAALPSAFNDAVHLAHPSWRPTLLKGLSAVMEADSAYLEALATEVWLPSGGRIFAAFTQPLEAVRFILIGEGPYPREESATGYCFMDGAVNDLWSEAGLSKRVNRATSLRNFMKMLLVGDGELSLASTTGPAMASVGSRAMAKASGFIQTRAELQENLHRNGFLLLNAAMVFRPEVAPVKDARKWQPFLETVLAAVRDAAISRHAPVPVLVLWGKIAELLAGSAVVREFPSAIAEHPYNLSFIGNAEMHALFAPMRLLRKR
jgi:uracil-DNA glycosylase